MNRIQQLFNEPSPHETASTVAPADQPRVRPIRKQAEREGFPSADSLHQDQVHALVQQLFFRQELTPVRHVGFAPADASTETATLCFTVARALAADDKYDVGLIDAHSDSTSLCATLRIPLKNRPDTPWLIEPRLWIVPRQSWLPEGDRGRTNDRSLSRLRDLTSEFDFSILWCAPVSWLTASIGQSCDGLVLVLAANSTRRMVALQIKDQLDKAQIPLLGTVLAGRRFPVPQGLYRSL